MPSLFLQRLFWLFYLALLPLCFNFVQAETLLIPATGEVLVGKQIKEENGLRYFESLSLGLITIPIEKSELRPDKEQEQPITDTLNDLESNDQTKSASSKNQLPFPFSLIEKENKYWTGKLKFGLSDRAGDTKETDFNFTGSLSIDRPDSTRRYKWSTFYNYEAQENSKTKDEYGIDFTFKQDVSKELFVVTYTSYEVDLPKKIFHEWNQSLGLGYTVINTDRVNWEIMLSPSFEYIDTGGSAGSESEYLGTLNERFTWKQYKDFEFIHSFEFLVPFEEPNDYEWILNLGIETTLFGPILLTVEYKVEYDNNPLDGVGKDDRRFTSSIGYKF